MYQQSMNFSIEYSWHDCGGVLVSPAELTSPGFPGTYPPNTHCAWKIDFDEGQQVLVSPGVRHSYPSPAYIFNIEN